MIEGNEGKSSRVGDGLDDGIGGRGIGLDAETVHGAGDDVVGDDNVADGGIAVNGPDGDSVSGTSASVALRW